MALSFEEDLQHLLNRHSAEAPSGTPDYILAEMLTEILKTFNEAVGQRAEWRGESVELPALQRQPDPKFDASKIQMGETLDSMFHFIESTVDTADHGDTINISLVVNKSSD